MHLELNNWKDLVILVIVIASFILFGEEVGWRVFGGFMLLSSLVVLYNREIGVGWEGRPPAFYIKGWFAIMCGCIGLVFSLFFIVEPFNTMNYMKSLW